MRWVLLDEVLNIKRSKVSRTRSRFPDNNGEYGPQVLMIEMMAQTGALLVGLENDFKKDLIFAKIDDAEFGEDLIQGTPIEIEARVESLRPEGGWISSSIWADGKKYAASRFLLMNVGHFLPNQTEPITFHPAFIEHFKIREKIS